MRQSLVNSKDSSAIINKMLLYWKAIDLSSGCATICEKCHDKLSSNKLGALSLNNLMWLGDVPPELQCLTLSEQKLIALVTIKLQCIRIVNVLVPSSIVSTFKLCHQVVLCNAGSIFSTNRFERQRENIPAKCI